MLYSALPDEVPTQKLFDEFLAQGKTVLLPRVVSDTDMELRRYTGRHDLQEGAYGIMEPTGELFTDYDAIDVAIVPGMAFDADGHRLGRGKGYYDRFLSRVPNIYKIGLCFSWQMVDCVPSDEHDIMMDEVIQI
jgi:5-formyltetrahydrofolate cyclo-ligase